MRDSLPGQAGEADVMNYVAPMRCGDEVGMNDRGVFVPQGLKREEILAVGKVIQEEFELPKSAARCYARQILITLRDLNIVR
jgi:hypothetical protein